VIDIVDLHEHAEATLGDVRKRLDAVMAEHSGNVDMLLLLEVMDDLMQDKFTTGDIAAVYAYRLGKRAQSS